MSGPEAVEQERFSTFNVEVCVDAEVRALD